MKLRNSIIVTVLVCSWTVVQAQESSQNASSTAQPAQVNPYGTNNNSISEPSGANRPAPLPDPLNPAQPQEQPSRNGGALTDPSGAEKRSTNIQSESAGAQRGNTAELAKALATIKTGPTTTNLANMQLTHAIRTSIQFVPNEFVERLSRDLSMSLKTVQLKEEVRAQLAQTLNTVLTAQAGSQTEVEEALSTIQTLLIDNGVSRPSARAIACDLHLIATEAVPNLQISVPVPK